MLSILAWTVAILVAIPLLIFTIECLASLLPISQPPKSDPAIPRPPLAILIPAHNEEMVLSGTIRSLLPQLFVHDRLIVIADNCTDTTAQLAADAGATTVLTRTDDLHRGKGFALSFGLKHLQSNPPPIVIVIDADCEVRPNALSALAQAVTTTNRPCQAIYLMDQPRLPTPKDFLSALAFLFKNQVRPLGLRRLGLPCLLTGTGMAFPWSTLSQVSLASGNIVEDMQLGLDLALAGHPPKLCPQAHVRGLLPGPADAALTQRRRWEHGHLQTLVKQVPRLVFNGFLKARPGLLALAADLAVPPLALLVAAWLTAVILSILAASFGLAFFPLILLLAAGLLMAISLFSAWFCYARHQIPFLALLTVPFYILWKIPLYFTFFTRREKDWVRTQRG